MLEKIRKALQKTNNPNRSAYFWNAITSILSALQSIIILAVVTRTNGVYDAGVFSIGYAVGALMINVGMFGVRRYQATDIKEKYAFEDYHGMRIITCSIMLAGSLGYCLYGAIFNDYSAEKFAVVLLICLFKAVQAYSDVLHGRMQQRGRLDIPAKAATVRFIAAISVCIILLVLTHSLLISILFYTIVFYAMTLLISVNVSMEYCSFKPRFSTVSIKGLALSCMPLFICTFLSNYLGNAPKYAIDIYLNEEVQAYFGYIFMPAFAINMVTNFVFNPMLTNYAVLWNNCNYNTFIFNIKKMSVAIALFTIFGTGIAYICGIPILSAVFGIELTGYRFELCIVVIGGGLLAYTTYFINIITIIRHQRDLIIGYAAVSLLTLFLSKYFITYYGIMGAVELYAADMGFLAAIFALIVAIRIKKDIK